MASNIKPFSEVKISSSSKRNFQKICLIYFWICVFFLSAPVQHSRSKSSLFKFVIHVVWCLFMICSTLAAAYGEFSNSDKDLSDVQKFLHLTEYMINAVIMTITPAVCYAKQKFFKKASQEILGIDKDLSRIIGDLSYKIFTRFMYIYLVFMGIFITATLPILSFYEDLLIYGILRSCAIYLFPSLVNSFQLGQYYCILVFVRERMTSITTFIQKMHLGSKENLDSLTCLRVVFSRLEYLHFNVNEIASPIVGIAFLGAFFITSNQLFDLYQDIAENKIRRWDLSFFSLVWLCLHFGKVICLYWVNTRIIKARCSLSNVLNDQDHVTSNDTSVSFF